MTPPPLRFTVLLGSPRGAKSGSLQMARHADKVSRAEFTYLDLAGEYKRLTRDRGALEQALDTIAGADAIVWAVPAYSLFVSAQMKSVLDAVLAAGRQDVFAGKHCVALMTSIRLGDDYILDSLRRLSERLGMRWVSEYSAPSTPYFAYWENQQMSRFYEPGQTVELGIARVIGELEQAVAEDLAFPARHARLAPADLEYAPPGELGRPPRERPRPAGRTCRVLVQQQSIEVKRVLGWLHSATGLQVEVEDLSALEVGACLGCYRCEQEGKGECVRQDDAFPLYQRLEQADATVVISDNPHGLHVHPSLKAAIDREWSFLHREMMQGRYLLPVVIAPRSERHEVGEYLTRLYGAAGYFTLPPLLWDADLDGGQLRFCLQRFDAAVREQSFLPRKFWAYASRLLLREYVFLGRPGLPLDYRHFKRHGMFDFPDRSLARHLGLEALRMLMLPESIRKRIIKGRRRGLGLEE